MLTLDGLTLARDGFRLTADLQAGPGITAVIGPSGGGKSTLLALIAGFETPDRGRILWDGQDLTPLAPGARPVATLFQDNNLFPHLDILTNVALGAAPVARPPRAALDKAAHALARVGLDGYGARLPSSLSGGQQSRAALARVLLTQRPVVLLDEPFSALGPALRAEMLELVRDLLPAATILMVTHAPEDARRVSRQTIFVDEGNVAAPLATEVLFDNPPETLRRYLA